MLLSWDTPILLGYPYSLGNPLSGNLLRGRHQRPHGHDRVPHRRNIMRDTTRGHRDHPADRDDGDGLRLCRGDAVHVTDATHLEALIERGNATPHGVMMVMGVRLSERVRDDYLIAFDVPPEPIRACGLSTSPQ